MQERAVESEGTVEESGGTALLPALGDDRLQRAATIPPADTVRRITPKATSELSTAELSSGQLISA